MIESYTMNFGSAVSQKELEKAVKEGVDSVRIQKLHKLKARIELVLDYKYLRILDEFIKSTQKSGEGKSS